MFRIAICDDELIFAEELKELISGYMTEKGLVFKIDTYSSGEDLVKLGIEVVRYTVVFLDINMEKMDGIKVAEKNQGSKQGSVYCICNRLCELFFGRVSVRCCQIFVKRK